MTYSNWSPAYNSALKQYIDASSKENLSDFKHDPHLLHLALQIQHNLQHQHKWTELALHFKSPITQKSLPRPLIAGLPPKRLYIHPDEQTDLLKHEMKRFKSHRSPEVSEQKFLTENGGCPEREWVLPTHVGENWSLKAIAQVFDAVETVPLPLKEERDSKGLQEENGDSTKEVGWQWRGSFRQKRLLMATADDDSTVVYYIIHDGIVKPRQN